MNCFGELSNKFTNVFILEGCPQIKQIFCLETVFIHGINMCEGVSENSRHGIGHVDIRVRIMNSLECVCFPLHEHLGGSNSCRKISLLGIVHLVMGSPFQLQGVFKKAALLGDRF